MKNEEISGSGDLNLNLPGNPRYQPRQMQAIFGYDYLYKTYIEVEMATLETLYEAGVIPKEDYDSIDADVNHCLSNITTTMVDKWERAVTKHDIRALVQIMKQIFGPKAEKWLHIPLTSYDVIDTGRSISYYRAFQMVIEPCVYKLLSEIKEKIIANADIAQVGRTHGQHAIPITVGFWLATIANRIIFNYLEMSRLANELAGKISGAVGAYNAQSALGLNDDFNFERKVLAKLGLKPAVISTQILPPEPLAYFLFSASMMSATLGQFGRDGRHLMRTEISEIAERFSSKQVGSSTMSHKRNPINFENLEGMWLRTKNEFGKVMDTLITDHQRDLVGSCIARDFPIILINLQHQLNTLLRSDGHGGTFVSNIVVDVQKCKKNLEMSQDFFIAEPLYIALQIAGYPGDAHDFVSHTLMDYAKKHNCNLYDALLAIASSKDGRDLKKVVDKIPEQMKEIFRNPATYVGSATKKAMDIVENIDIVLGDLGC